MASCEEAHSIIADFLPFRLASRASVFDSLITMNINWRVPTLTIAGGVYVARAWEFSSIRDDFLHRNKNGVPLSGVTSLLSLSWPMRQQVIAVSALCCVSAGHGLCLFRAGAFFQTRDHFPHQSSTPHARTMSLTNHVSPPVVKKQK